MKPEHDAEKCERFSDDIMETAGITLVRGDLRGIVQARRLSQLTMPPVLPRRTGVTKR